MKKYILIAVLLATPTFAIAENYEQQLQYDQDHATADQLQKQVMQQNDTATQRQQNQATEMREMQQRQQNQDKGY